MPPSVLWVYFLGDQSANDVRPTLWVGDGRDGREIDLSDRARALIAALAVPPEMAAGPRWTSAQLSTWSSGDVLQRMGYGHRRAIQDAIKDLRRHLDEVDLELNHYLHADKRRGRYGLNNVRVDAVEVVALADRHKELDRLLSSYSRDPANTAFSSANEHLWSTLARERITEILHAASPLSNTDYGQAPGKGEPGKGDEPQDPPPQPTQPVPAEKRDRRRPPLWALALAALAALPLAAGAAVVLISGDDSPSRASSTATATAASGATRVEVPGGLAHAWTDYTTGQGKAGPSLRPSVDVRVSCRIRGLKVDDGNVWWYRLASAPWSNHFYATADAFYNNGHRSGPLRRTPFFDPKVPVCP